MKSPQGKSSVPPDHKLKINLFFPVFCNCDSLVPLSCRIVCETTSSGGEKSGHTSVKVRGGGLGLSAQIFSFQVNTATISVYAHERPGYSEKSGNLVCLFICVADEQSEFSPTRTLFLVFLSKSTAWSNRHWLKWHHNVSDFTLVPLEPQKALK